MSTEIMTRDRATTRWVHPLDGATALSEALVPGDDRARRSPTPSASLESRFMACAEAWKRDTRHMSSITKITSHPAYQEIIEMGEVVIPLILRELAKKPDHWFLALREISGHDPVPKRSQGRLRDMTESWLAWGRKQGYTS